MCLHLFSQEQGASAPDHYAPEITYADLAPFWLELLQWGVRESGQLTWLDAPPALAAVDTLTRLGAIDARQNLTPAGRAMAGYGCDPRLGAMLYHAGEEADAVATAALLAAMIEEPPKSGSPDIRDHFHRPLPHWTARARQLRSRRGGGEGRPDLDLAPLLLAWGFRDRIARCYDADGRYQLASGAGAALAPDDALSAQEWLIAPGPPGSVAPPPCNGIRTKVACGSYSANAWGACCA